MEDYAHSTEPNSLTLSCGLAFRIQPEWLLGGAAVVIFAGVAATALKRAQQAPRALPATATQIDADDAALATGAVPPPQQAATPEAQPDSEQQANWWEQREIFIVADSGDGQDPATAGPILFQAEGRAIMPAFQVRPRPPLAPTPPQSPHPSHPSPACRNKPQPRRLPTLCGRGTATATVPSATAHQTTPGSSRSSCSRRQT